ncbi:hypothetical protein Tco_0128880 [Tanacetum coccineum]
MYLAASRPDLVFVVCMCVRYYAKPTKKHVEVIKRVFRYLRRTINLGLWYLKDTAMALTAYADADHEGCHDTRRNKMADENVPAPAPTRSDDQILPFNAWLPVGKGNLLLDLQKSQKNPIFRISALDITPVDSAYPFESPPAGKTSGNDKPIHPILQILWGIVTRTNVDYVELLHNLHRRLGSPVHVTGDDFLLGNLKFIPKGEKDEVFGKPIPQELIIEAI